MKMKIINEKGNKPQKELYKCIRKSRKYGFLILDLMHHLGGECRGHRPPFFCRLPA
jgi:hypothetical protein